ncbi:MAG: YraN family protein [bacterium]|nr:YraN family protein [bacterium]
MKNHISIGKIGEDMASKYLQERGCRIIERNYKERFGEIDIIAKGKGGRLLFVEVKTLAKNEDENALIPEDNMSASKIGKFKRVAQAFANANPALVRENAGWQIDCIAISIPRQALERADDLTYIMENSEMRYYENIG